MEPNQDRSEESQQELAKLRQEVEAHRQELVKVQKATKIDLPLTWAQHRLETFDIVGKLCAKCADALWRAERVLEDALMDDPVMEMTELRQECMATVDAAVQMADDLRYEIEALSGNAD
jgi:hypothetical protein